jgi:hypothetical protein
VEPKTIISRLSSFEIDIKADGEDSYVKKYWGYHGDEQDEYYLLTCDAVYFFYYYSVCEAIGTVAAPGLLCQPRVIMKMIMEKQMESRLAGETEVLGETLPQRHFCPSQNPTWPDPGLNPGHRGGKPATNRLSYGAAWCSV